MSEDPRVTFGRANQELTLQEIGDHFGVTRERIRQVFAINSYKHPDHTRTAATEERFCHWPGCRRRFIAQVASSHKSCDVHRGTGRPRTAQRVTVVCAACGLAREVLKTYADRRSIFFCDKRCQGKWLGQGNEGRKRVQIGGPDEADKQS